VQTTGGKQASLRPPLRIYRNFVVEEQAENRIRGRWLPGQSGNPSGRPRGSRNKLTMKCAELLGDNAEEIMAQLVKQAKKGEPIALRLCVERLLPVRAARDRSVELDGLPAMQKAQDLVSGLAAVIERAAAGDITLSEAKEFASLIEAERKAIETAELTLRIEALEHTAAKGPVGFAPGESEAQNLAARIRRLELPERGE